MQLVADGSEEGLRLASTRACCDPAQPRDPDTSKLCPFYLPCATFLARTLRKAAWLRASATSIAAAAAAIGLVLVM